MAIENSTTFIINSIDGDGIRGGWQANGSFANDQGEAVYGRRIDIYYTPEGNGIWEDDPILAIKGTIFPRSVKFDIRQSGTEVIVATTDHYLRNAALQGIYFTNIDPRTNPHQDPNLRLGSIVKHIAEQHTNMSSTANVQNTNGTDSGNPIGGWVDTTGIDTNLTTKVDVFTVRQSNSIWQSTKKIAKNEFYVVYMTRDDKMIYEPHPVFAATTPAITLAIDNTMMVGQPEIIFRDQVQLDQVLLSALTDNGDILRAKFPANVPSDGRRLNITNLRCNTQARLDNLAQRAFSFESRLYDLKLFLAGPWGLFLELFDRISITYSGTVRNGVSLSFSAEPFYVEKIRVTRSGNFGAITELTLQQENVSGTIYA